MQYQLSTRRARESRRLGYRIKSRTLCAAIAIGDRVETGTIFMNRCDYLDPALVWTGVKDTGKGAALSEIGYLSLTRPKSFHLRARS